MAGTTHVLVVANRTADSDELFETLRERAEQGPITVTMLLPQDSHGGMGRRLNAGLRRLHEAGIEAEGMLGDVDPAIAVQEIWDAERFDEVYVSTLPTELSHWLEIGLLERVKEVTGAPVHHVLSREASTKVPL
jgi:hypothetical protein